MLKARAFLSPEYARRFSFDWRGQPSWTATCSKSGTCYCILAALYGTQRATVTDPCRSGQRSIAEWSNPHNASGLSHIFRGPMKDQFTWHPGSKLLGNGYCLTRREVEASSEHARKALKAPLVRFIPADLPQREIYLTIFKSIRENTEFCVVDSISTAAGLSAKTLDAADLSEPTGPARNAIKTFQCTSSGSSGKPKRIRRTHKSWIRCFDANARLWNLDRSERYVILGALSHSLSLYGAMEALHLGAVLIDASGQRPDKQLAKIETCKPSVIYATPSQIKLLFEACGRKPLAPVHSLKRAFIGGSNLDQPTADACRCMFPEAETHQFYGASETSFIAMSSRETPKESTGKAFPNVEIEVRSSEGGKLGVDEIGEIWVRSPYLFEGYASHEQGSAAWDAGWVSVGEIGSLDSTGNLYINGRMDRAVQIADKTVHPERIEGYLAGLKGVENSAIVPIKDRMRGISLVAFVKMHSKDAFDATAILRACRSEFGSGISPRKIVAVDEWPLLHSGKTDYSALRAKSEE